MKAAHIIHKLTVLSAQRWTILGRLNTCMILVAKTIQVVWSHSRQFVLGKSVRTSSTLDFCGSPATHFTPITIIRAIPTKSAAILFRDGSILLNDSVHHSRRRVPAEPSPPSRNNRLKMTSYPLCYLCASRRWIP